MDKWLLEVLDRSFAVFVAVYVLIRLERVLRSLERELERVRRLMDRKA